MVLRVIGQLLLLFYSLNCYSQSVTSAKKDSLPSINRGNLVFNINKKGLDSFIRYGSINLNYVRKVCNNLTNENISKFKQWQIPNRNQAFIRHIKHINELLEEEYQDNAKVEIKHLELFYELALFYESFNRKIISNASNKISFNEKRKMVYHTIKSVRVFRYKLNGIEKANKNNSNLEIKDPIESPYWHKKINTIPLDKRFSHLAKLKKIKAKKEMLVLFDKTSLSGSSPKVNVSDIDRENKWVLKWGDEVHTDVLGSYLFAALGYDVDHPYFYGKDKLTLIFDTINEIKNHLDLVQILKKIYKVDINAFISSYGIVDIKMVDSCKDLYPFIGKQYVRFIKCAIEARPDRVKRIGSFVPDILSNSERRELKGALLVNQFIGNWDTKEANTLLTTVHMGNYKYRMSAVFSDLGTSFGVELKLFPQDFKVGLVNAFPWEVAINKHGILRLNNKMNSILNCYKKASYNDLLWMAFKIAELDSNMLWNMVKKAEWPNPIAQLYFHKLASRRASILIAFKINDKHPIPFNKHLTLVIDGVAVIKDGVLTVDYDRKNNPESFLSNRGRFRNYGN